MPSVSELDKCIGSLTCKGEISEPKLPLLCQSMIKELNFSFSLDCKSGVKLKEMERWNSVRVTFSIGADAAERLRNLASASGDVLARLGILSIQMPNGQVISVRQRFPIGSGQESPSEDGSAGTRAGSAPSGPELGATESPNQTPQRQGLSRGSGQTEAPSPAAPAVVAAAAPQVGLHQQQQTNETLRLVGFPSLAQRPLEPLRLQNTTTGTQSSPSHFTSQKVGFSGLEEEERKVAPQQETATVGTSYSHGPAPPPPYPQGGEVSPTVQPSQLLHSSPSLHPLQSQLPSQPSPLLVNLLQNQQTGGSVQVANRGVGIGFRPPRLPSASPAGVTQRYQNQATQGLAFPATPSVERPTSLPTQLASLSGGVNQTVIGVVTEEGVLPGSQTYAAPRVPPLPSSEGLGRITTPLPILSIRQDVSLASSTSLSQLLDKSQQRSEEDLPQSQGFAGMSHKALGQHPSVASQSHLELEQNQLTSRLMKNAPTQVQPKLEPQPRQNRTGNSPGKSVQYLINPLTGVLEPMSPEGSESDEGERGGKSTPLLPSPLSSPTPSSPPLPAPAPAPTPVMAQPAFSHQLAALRVSQAQQVPVSQPSLIQANSSVKEAPPAEAIQASEPSGPSAQNILSSQPMSQAAQPSVQTSNTSKLPISSSMKLPPVSRPLPIPLSSQLLANSVKEKLTAAIVERQNQASRFSAPPEHPKPSLSLTADLHSKQQSSNLMHFEESPVVAKRNTEWLTHPLAEPTRDVENQTPKVVEEEKPKPEEKIRLRLKIEKTVDSTSQYKAETGGVNGGSGASSSEGSSTPGLSLGLSLGGASPLGDSSQPPPPRVPPLHISLRGRPAVVSKGPFNNLSGKDKKQLHRVKEEISSHTSVSSMDNSVSSVTPDSSQDSRDWERERERDRDRDRDRERDILSSTTYEGTCTFPSEAEVASILRSMPPGGKILSTSVTSNQKRKKDKKKGYISKAVQPRVEEKLKKGGNLLKSVVKAATKEVRIMTASHRQLTSKVKLKNLSNSQPVAKHGNQTSGEVGGTNTKSGSSSSVSQAATSTSSTVSSTPSTQVNCNNVNSTTSSSSTEAEQEQGKFSKTSPAQVKSQTGDSTNEGSSGVTAGGSDWSSECSGGDRSNPGREQEEEVSSKSEPAPQGGPTPVVAASSDQPSQGSEAKEKESQPQPTSTTSPQSTKSEANPPENRKEDDDLDDILPVRRTPALYTYSNPERQRDEDTPSPDNNVEEDRFTRKSLLEQLLVDVPSQELSSDKPGVTRRSPEVAETPLSSSKRPRSPSENTSEPSTPRSKRKCENLESIATSPQAGTTPATGAQENDDSGDEAPKKKDIAVNISSQAPAEEKQISVTRSTPMTRRSARQTGERASATESGKGAGDVTPSTPLRSGLRKQHHLLPSSTNGKPQKDEHEKQTQKRRRTSKEK